MSNSDTSRNLPRKTRKFTTETFQDLEGTWRTNIRTSHNKFDDDMKRRFLEEYKEHARIATAAVSVGISASCVREHIMLDKEFAKACLEAENHYHDRLIKHHQNLVFNGTVKESYDRNGGLVSRETIYPIRLIELELKKHDEGYRDKREVSMNVNGGVLVAPADVNSIDDWEKRFSEAKVISPEQSDGEKESS